MACGWRLIAPDGQWMRLECGLAQVLACGDLNGDGIPDLVMASYNGCNSNGNQQVFLGDGTGNFTEIGSIPFGGSEAWATLALALGDVDRDGRLDLVTCKGGDITLLLGNGDGTFTVRDVLVRSNTKPEALELGDVNGDGALDLIVGNRGANLLFIGLR